MAVTYTNPQGIHFFQTGAGSDTDYWDNAGGGRDPATSPYTSDVVENIPTGTDLVALKFAGSQTLTFSEVIANPVFSYVSLNGNGYAFDQDFEILSFGDLIDGDWGHFGCGTSFKSVVDLGGGIFEYQLLGTGEPHGTIRFLGVFETLTWRSISDETWNGFTVGVQGTAAEVGVPVNILDGTGQGTILNDDVSACDPGETPGPIELIDALKCKVDDLVTKKGTNTAANAKLDAARSSLLKEKEKPAISSLNAFVKFVSTRIGKQLTHAQADDLIGDAEADYLRHRPNSA